MTVYSVDPLQDLRWTEFVDRHPNGSVFHTTGWLRALQRTYRFEPIAFTTSGPTEGLRNALVFCAVRSRLTGRRLVSLPFSDHCEPLVDDPEELRALGHWVQALRAQSAWKYVELRSAMFTPSSGSEGFREARAFYLHRLDIRPDPKDLLCSFHKNSIQAMIRRAEREGLTYEEGRSDVLLHKLYDLLELTRQRHQVPPQPLAWFRNLIECLGERLCIRIVSKEARPVAGILTVSHRKTVVYKYGGSDARLNHLGGTPFLIWKAIRDAKEIGAEELDLGRSDCDNSGLVMFKERWSADRSILTYWRYPGETQRASGDGWKMAVAKEVFAKLPHRVRTVVGKLLYRHIG